MTAAELSALTALFRKYIKTVPGGPAGLTGGTRGVGMLTILDALARAIANNKGGAAQWVAGPQQALSLVSDAGLLYLVLQDVADGQDRPAADAINYLAVGPFLTTNNRWTGTNTYEQGLLLSALGGAPDLGLRRSAAGVLEINTGVAGSPATVSAMDYVAQAAPAAYNSFTKLVNKVIANEARLGATTAADPAAPVSRLVWQFVGAPGNRNVSLGEFDASNVLGGNAFRNRFGASFQANTIGTLASDNVFENGIYYCTIGSRFTQNVLGAVCAQNVFGDNNARNTLGSQVQFLNTGNDCTDNTFASNTGYITLGNSVVGCRVGPGCLAVALGDGCQRVELYNCGGAGYTQDKPFRVPAGSKDVVYRNNVPVGSGTPAPTTPNPLLSPFMVSSTAGLVGYATIDAALAASAGQFLHINGRPTAASLRVTVSNENSPVAIFGNGNTINVLDGQVLQLNYGCTLHDTTIRRAGTGSVLLQGGGAGAGVLPHEVYVQFIHSSITAPVTLDDCEAHLYTASLLASVNTTSTGSVYLYDSSSVTAHDANVTVVAPSGGGGAATYDNATYPVGAAGGAQTITPTQVPGLAQASKIEKVGVVGIDAGGDPVLDLLPRDNYSFDASSHTLTVLASAGLDANDVLEIAWLTAGGVGPPAPSTGAGIDYANPVAHRASTTLTSADLNKLHVLSGADFTLTLPAGIATGARLRIQVESDATGFYTIVAPGSDLNGLPSRVLWATESAELVYDGSSWNKLSGLSRAMSLRIRLSEPSFSYPVAQALRVPCRAVVGTDLAQLHNQADGTVKLRRTGKYGVVAFNAMQNAPAGTHCESFARLNGGNSENTILNTIIPSNLKLAFGSAVGTMQCTAGDYIELSAYADAGATALLSNPNTISNLLVEEHLDW